MAARCSGERVWPFLVARIFSICSRDLGLPLRAVDSFALHSGERGGCFLPVIAAAIRARLSGERFDPRWAATTFAMCSGDNLCPFVAVFPNLPRRISSMDSEECLSPSVFWFPFILSDSL